MADPTPEEIAEFKRAFKLSAQQANSWIRWEEPSGCLAFLQTQTSLAPIVEALEELQTEPSAENIQAVLTVIEEVPDAKSTKYEEAIRELTDSLVEALEEAVEPETTEDVVEETAPPVTATVDTETEPEPTGVEIDEAPEAPVETARQRHVREYNEFLDESGLRGSSPEDINEAWDEHLDDLHSDEIQSALETWGASPVEPAGLTSRMRLLAEEIGFESDDAFWMEEDFWKEWLRFTRYDIEFEEDTTAAEHALSTATFDPAAVPAPTVMDQLLQSMPGWKHDRNIVVDDGHMSMSFQKSIKDSAVGGVEYWTGEVPGLDTCTSISNMKVTDLPEQDQAMIQVAKTAINKIRSNLTKGPFNNYRGLPEEVIAQQRIPPDVLAEVPISQELLEEHGREALARMPAPAWWNAVVEVAALKAMNQVKRDNADVNEQKLQMACLARATQEVGGGVCSKMAMCTTGELTTSLPPGSEIVQLFHDFDHEFVIARVPGGNWFAVDPWPHDPTVLPFVDCQFRPEGVKNYVMTVVTETAEHPFGINLEGVNWTTTINAAMRETQIDALEMKGVYGHPGNKDSGNYDPALNTNNNWG